MLPNESGKARKYDGWTFMREITIQDVARAARVSPSSISNYLNGRHDQMRADTRERIREVIERLGYKPNSAARQLKTGHAPMLGLLVPTIANQFFGELAAEIEMAAQKYGFRTLLCNTLREKEREREFAAELVSYGIRGLILGSAIRDREGVLSLIQRGVSVVAFDVMSADLAIEGLDVVTIDNIHATRMAVQYLADLGHKKITYVSAPLGTIGRDARLRGFEQGLVSRGLVATGSVVVENAPKSRPAYGDTDLVQLGRQAAARLCSSNDRPTAVIAMNDLIATGMAMGLREAGVMIPDGMSLIGIDDVAIASMTMPSLTTVRQPFPEMAEAAVVALCARMNDQKLPTSETVFTPELIVRDSTARART